MFCTKKYWNLFIFDGGIRMRDTVQLDDKAMESVA